MIVEDKNGLSVFRFENLSRFEELAHGVFSRKGGVSSGPFDSLNVGFGVGDDADNVERNREVVSKALGDLPLACLRQVHSDKIKVLGDGAPLETFRNRAAVPEGDAFVTDMPGASLVIQTADCQAVLLYDPVSRVAANVHSGWRGSILNIAGKTVDSMKKRFGVDPKNIRAGIGPSLGPCCAEFVNYKNEIPENLWKYKTDGRRFDFWKMTGDQLKSEGVPPENIETSHICTRCRTDFFFSYRKEKVTGRFAAAIGMKQFAKVCSSMKFYIDLV